MLVESISALLYSQLKLHVNASMYRLRFVIDKRPPSVHGGLVGHMFTWWDVVRSRGQRTSSSAWLRITKALKNPLLKGSLT